MNANAINNQIHLTSLCLPLLLIECYWTGGGGRCFKGTHRTQNMMYRYPKVSSIEGGRGRKGTNIFYLTMRSKLIYDVGNMVEDNSDSERENPLPIKQQGIVYMYHPTDRIAHTTALVKSSHGGLTGTRNISIGLLRGIHPTDFKWDKLFLKNLFLYSFII